VQEKEIERKMKNEMEITNKEEEKEMLNEVDFKSRLRSRKREIEEKKDYSKRLKNKKEEEEGVKKNFPIIEKDNKIEKKETELDDLEQYTPMKDKLKLIKTELIISKITIDDEGEEKNQSNVIQSVDATPNKLDFKEYNICLKNMKKIPTKEDVALANVSGKGKNFLWPVRRIRNMTGLNASTQEDLRKRKIVEDSNPNLIKPSVQVYARIFGDEKTPWTLHIANKKFKIRSFNDETEQRKINEAIKKVKSDKLFKAMELAKEMFNDVPEVLQVSPPVKMSSNSEKPIEEVERAIPLPEQIFDPSVKPLEVEFRAGMKITFSAPNIPDSKAKIVEVSLSSTDNEYFILLEDNTILCDDMYVGAEPNKVMFLYKDLKEISKFIPGKDGEDWATKAKTILDNYKDEAREHGANI